MVRAGVQEFVGPLRVLAVLGGVQQRVADARGAAAAAVVVPEPGAEALRDTRDEDRVQASLAQFGDLQAGDLGDPGVGQRREKVGGPGGPVAPRVGHRLHFAGGRRDGVRHDEPAVVQRAHGQQVLCAPAAARRSPGGPGPPRRRPARWRPRRCRASSSASWTAHPAAFPSPARLGAVGSTQQTLPAGDRDRLGMLTARPDRRQHDASGAA